MKNSKILIHVLIWVALIAVSIFLMGDSSLPKGGQLITSTVIWLAYFYINYLLLIPRLMMRKRRVVYVISVLVISAGAFVALKNSDIYFMKSNMARQSEILEGYSDVRSSFEEKERELREIRRQRRINERTGERGPQPRPQPFGDSVKAGEGVAGTPAAIPLQPLPDRVDSIVFTPREEDYGRLARDYEHAAWNLRGMDNKNYNPFHFGNYGYSFVIIILYLISLVLAFVQKSVNEEQKRSELESEKTAAELAYLKQQINPHFLFNTLNAIYSYTLSVSEPASEAVLKLSSMLRYMLYETTREKVPLADEIAAVDDYIDLQKLRVTDKTSINITMNGDPVGLHIEPMLLIPILENAFKFGVDSFEESFICIGFDIHHHDFTFTVSNKIVHRNSPDNNSSGIGIKNIRRRLDLIYGDNYKLATGEKEGIFYVSLHLNLKD